MGQKQGKASEFTIRATGVKKRVRAEQIRQQFTQESVACWCHLRHSFCGTSVAQEDVGEAEGLGDATGLGKMQYYLVTER